MGQRLHDQTYQQHNNLQGRSYRMILCQEEMSLRLAGSQTRAFEDIHEYLRLDAADTERFFAGKTLCMVALTCWYFMLSKELHRALDMLRGCCSLPRGRSRLESVELNGFVAKYVL